MSTENNNFAIVRSDYDPGTIMRIVRTDDMDISIRICGKGEFKIAGIGGGGYLPIDRKMKVIKLFSDIIDTLQGE
jgi:hypothetical protein